MNNAKTPASYQKDGYFIGNLERGLGYGLQKGTRFGRNTKYKFMKMRNTN
jgi:hypothetical protein